MKKIKRINMVLTFLCVLLIITIILLHQIGKKSTTLSQSPKLSPSAVTESKVKFPPPPPQPIRKKVLPVEEEPQPGKELNPLKEEGERPLIPF